MQASQCYFSVVIPTYNRLGRLRHVIAALEQQAYPLDDYEVIVISDGSTDGTTDAILKTSAPRCGCGGFRNPIGVPLPPAMRGSSKPAESIIVFIDDDLVPEPQLLEEHARSHREAGKDVVVLGPCSPPSALK